MPLYQWTSIELGQCDKDIEEGAIKPTKGIKDVLPRSEKEEGRNHTDPRTEVPHREEHVLNADKWGTMLETAQEGRKRKALISSTTTSTTSRLTSHRPPYQETL